MSFITKFRYQKICVLVLMIFFMLTTAGCSTDPREEFMTSLESANYDRVVDIYNSEFAGSGETEEFDEILQTEIDELLERWDCGDIDVESAQSSLKKLELLLNEDLAQAATDNYEIVTIEGIGRNLHIEAEEHYANDELAEAMNCVLQMDKQYSQYDNAKELYDTSEKVILESVSTPYSSADCISFSNQLEKHLGTVENKKFANRKAELDSLVGEYQEAEVIVDEAADLYDEKAYTECFAILEKGLKQFPNNNLLTLALENSHSLYVVDVTQDVLTLCEKKDYKTALGDVEAAIDIYDCEAFKELKSSIWKQRSLIYRIASSVSDKFMAFTQNAEGETLTVKEMGAKAGSYVVLSGKKLALGDYSEENITVLSFTGEVLASIAGVDLMMDLRDVSYDLTHWGEDEYFIVHLATDTVALIPVIGAIKYFGLENVGKTVDALKQVDNISDVTKNAGKVADAADTIIDTNKSYKNIGEAIENAKEITVFSKIKNKYVRYRHISTINDRYTGKVHPIGVPFVSRNLDYTPNVNRKYGNNVQGGFPKFDCVYEVNLKNADLLNERSLHNRYCNEELKKEVQKNKKLKKKFSAEQLEEINSGIKDGAPSGYTWHHNEEEGVIQLVDREVHDSVAHTGGYVLWGAGSVKDAA